MPISGSITPAGSSATVPQAPSQVKFQSHDAPPMTPQPAAPPPPPEGEEKPAEGEEPKLEAWRLAAIAKKEAAARKALADAKAEREAAEKVRAEAATAQEEAKKVREDMALLRKDPTKFIEMFGLDYYNQLSQVIAQGGFTPEQQTARAVLSTQDQLQAMQKRLEEAEAKSAGLVQQLEERLKKEQAERASAEEQQAIDGFKEEIGDFVKAEPGYAFIRKMGPDGVNAIYGVIEEEFNKSGKRLGLKEAGEVVEGKLLEQAREFLADPEIRAKLLGEQQAPPRGARPTITNDMRPSATPTQPPRNETEQERRQRVLRQIEQAMGKR